MFAVSLVSTLAHALTYSPPAREAPEEVSLNLPKLRSRRRKAVSKAPQETHMYIAVRTRSNPFIGTSLSVNGLH